ELEAYLTKQGGKQNRIEARKMFEILDRALPPPPWAKSKTPDGLLTAGKVRIVEELGEGALGAAFLADVDGQQVGLKTLKEEQPLSLDRSGRANEAVASYLTSRKQPDYLLNKVKIAQPMFYLISAGTGANREYQMVEPRTMRRLVRDAAATGSEIKCCGLI